MELRFAKTKKGKTLFAVFIVMLVACSCLPIIAFSDDGPGKKYLENVTNPDVFRMVTVASWYRDLGRNLEWFILTGVAGLVDYFQDAVDTISSLNLYNLIKDQFDITSFAYPIAWAVASVAIVFMAVLLIYNADKMRITDFARGILTSLMLIIALPAMLSALSDLRTKGIAYVKASTGDVAVANSEGVYFKEKIGQKTLSKYVYYVWNSVKANQRVSVRGAENTWDPFGETDTTYKLATSDITYYPATLYSTNITDVLPYETTEYYVDNYDTAPVGLQTEYTELTYEKRRELAGIEPYYQEWQELRAASVPLSERTQEYIDRHYSPATTYGPCEPDNPNCEFSGSTQHFWQTGIYGEKIPGSDRWYWIYTKEAPDFKSSYEYWIVERAQNEVIYKLEHLGVTIDSAVHGRVRGAMSNSSSLADSLKKLDNIKVEFDGRNYTVMQLLNMKNNEAQLRRL